MLMTSLMRVTGAKFQFGTSAAMFTFDDPGGGGGRDLTTKNTDCLMMHMKCKHEGVGMSAHEQLFDFRFFRLAGQLATLSNVNIANMKLNLNLTAAIVNLTVTKKGEEHQGLLLVSLSVPEVCVVSIITFTLDSVKITFSRLEI